MDSRSRIGVQVLMMTTRNFQNERYFSVFKFFTIYLSGNREFLKESIKRNKYGMVKNNKIQNIEK